MPTASIDNRSAVLSSCGGRAVTAGELLEMGKEAGREFVRPHRLIYIYHDRIDSTGDDRKTETQARGAVVEQEPSASSPASSDTSSTVSTARWTRDA